LIQSPVPPTNELILERLLSGLLEKDAASAVDAAEAPAELLELRDMARLLRASVQWVPLPQSRPAVRRALLAAVEPAQIRRPTRDVEGYVHTAWRRTGRWLMTAAAAALIVTALALSPGGLGAAAVPTGPLYAVTLQIDARRVDNPRGVQQAAAALERQTGWLRAVARSLPPAERQRLAPVAAHTRPWSWRRAGRLNSGSAACCRPVCRWPILSGRGPDPERVLGQLRVITVAPPVRVDVVVRPDPASRDQAAVRPVAARRLARPVRAGPVSRRRAEVLPADPGVQRRRAGAERATAGPRRATTPAAER
jgi:hypothetical protein